MTQQTRIETYSPPVAGGAAARAAEILAQGWLAIMPTETVYGLFAPATGPGRGRLAALAGEGAAAGAAWHTDSAQSAIDRFAISDPTHLRLIQRLMPGPVTIVTDHADLPACRVPDHEVCAAALALANERCDGGIIGVKLEHPLADSGKSVRGLLGDSPAMDALADAGVRLIIDDGPARLGTHSTVIRLVAGSGYEIVREGALEARYIDKQLRRLVVFVCTGNTCRSPMAAAIARSLLTGDPHTVVASAGLSAGEGMPMTPEAAAALRDAGIDPGAHSSSVLTDRVITDADEIYTMTVGHRDAIVSAFPAAAGRVSVLDPEGRDVPDPYGGTQDEYDQTCRRIRELVEQRLASPVPPPIQVRGEHA